MANKVEILLLVDPSGQGSAAIKSVTAQVKGLKDAEDGVVSKGDIFAGLLSAEAVYNGVMRLAGAVRQFAEDSVKAYAELIQDERFLNAEIKQTGVNFNEAQTAVDTFDRGLALSRTNAEKLYATTLQFTKEIGKTDQTNRFIQSLADTLVAHGQSPEKEADIVRSLLAGRAMELAKVLGQNVTSIEKEMSLQAGVDFKNLDDAEKKALIFNKVLQEGEKNAGATRLRLAELDGELATISAAYDRAKESAGKFIVNQTFIGDIIKKIAGVKPDDLYKAHEQQALAQASAAYDAMLRRQTIQNELNQAFIKGDKGVEFKDFEHLAVSRGEESAKALVNSFIQSYDRLFKSAEKDDLSVLDFAEKQFNLIKGVLDPAKAEEIGEKLRAAIERQVNAGLQYLSKVKASAEKEFSTFLQAGTIGRGENPFVQIYVEAEKARLEFRKNFDVLNLSKEGVRQLAELEAAQRRIADTRLAAARVDESLASQRLRRQAQELENIRGLSELEERRLGILERQAAIATRVPELLGREAALRLGQVNVREGSPLQDAVINKQISNLLGLGRDIRGTGEGPERARNIVDTALTNLFDSLPERIQRRIARDPAGRGVFGDAFGREAAEAQREVQRQIARMGEDQRQAEQVRQFLNKELETVRRGGLPSPESDRRILEITGTLSGEQLREAPEIRKARFDSLIREADRRAGSEAEGKKIAEDARKSTDDLVGAVKEFVRAVQKPELRKILIEVLNKSKASVREDQLGGI